MQDPSRRSRRSRRRGVTTFAALIALVALMAGGSSAQEDAIPPIEGPIDAAFIARAYEFADSLGGSVLASLTGSPMLLIPGGDSDEVPPEVAERLRALEPVEIVILGGEVAVSAGAEAALADLQAEWRDPVAVRRIAGASRIETARLISEEIPSMVARAAEAVHAEEADHAEEAEHAEEADLAAVATTAVEAEHAAEADHAERADDADAVGGLGPEDLATADHTHEVQQAFSRFGDAPTDILPDGRHTPVSIEISAPDPCGDGLTAHRYLAEGSHNVLALSGDPGDVLPLATGVITEGEEVTFASQIDPFPSAHGRVVHRGFGNFTDTITTSRVIELGPGDHTLQLRVHNNSAETITTNFNTLIVRHFGYTCG